MICGYNRKNGLKQQHQNQNLLSALDIGKGELGLEEMMSENNGRVKVLSSIPNNFFFHGKIKCQRNVIFILAIFGHIFFSIESTREIFFEQSKWNLNFGQF